MQTKTIALQAPFVLATAATAAATAATAAASELGRRVNASLVLAK